MRNTQQSRDELPVSRNNQKKELVSLEPHVCRKCFGRLASIPLADGFRFVCTNCGSEAEGQKADVLCCCGIKIRKMGRNGSKAGQTLVDAGVRCIANPSPTPEFPSLYVASEVARK